MGDEAFAQKLSELGRTFRAQLPARLAELQQLAAADGPEALTELRAIAHKLAGQGGTFGAPEISAAAITVEEAEPAELPAALVALADAAAGIR